LQGLANEDVDHIAQGNPDSAKIPEKDRALLAYVKVLTLEPAKTTDELVETMRKTGWTDEQIFEASFITSLFAFLNRMADAYGLDYNMARWIPPELRQSEKAPKK